MRVDDFSLTDRDRLESMRLEQPWILKTDNLADLQRWILLKPDLVDIDIKMMEKGIAFGVEKSRLILSAHMQGDLEAVKKMMEKLLSYQAAIYKLVVMPPNRLEGLKITDYFRTIKHPQGVFFLLHQDYAYSRYFCLIDRHPLIYCGLEGQLTAQGQLTIDELLELPEVTPECKILGLIGDPVDKSIGKDVYHRYFKYHNINALYLNILLALSEVDEGLQWLKKLGFYGVSVTTPLKKFFQDHHLTPFPCNTWMVQEKKGFNTDTLGLWSLLEKESPSIQSVLILGFGALGQAVAAFLLEKGCKVFVYNRTKSSIEQFQQHHPIEIYQPRRQHFDVVVNTSSQAFYDADAASFFPDEGDLYVEAVQVPLMTPFVKNGIDRGKKVIFGYEWFLAQGAWQLAYFFPKESMDDFIPFSKGFALQKIRKKS